MSNPGVSLVLIKTEEITNIVGFTDSFKSTHVFSTGKNKSTINVFVNEDYLFTHIIIRFLKLKMFCSMASRWESATNTMPSTPRSTCWRVLS